MSKLLVKCLKCLQTNADNTVAAGGQGVGWAYCPSSCPVEGKLLCDKDINIAKGTTDPGVDCFDQ